MNKTYTREKGDCFIRSMCALWGKPYEYCRCVAHRYGFNNGMPIEGIIELLGPEEIGDYEPVKYWSAVHDQGRFLVEISNHVLSVINGVIGDTYSYNSPVLGYWEVCPRCYRLQ